MRKVINWGMKAASCLALALAVSSVNATCFAICYQPEIPESAMKFKR